MERPFTTMRLPLLAIAVVVVVASLGATVTAEEKATPPGKAVFLAHNCNTCHTVESTGIALKTADGTESEEGDKEASGTAEVTDLSDVGNAHSAGELDQYLLKKATIRDKKHQKRFRGTDEDRKALVEWLITLKLKTDSER